MSTNDEVIKEIRKDLQAYMAAFFKNCFKKNTEIDCNELMRLFADKYSLKIFDSLEEVIYLHFLQGERLGIYLDNLPEYIKQYQQSSELYYEKSNRQIRGNINWKRTINKRIRGEIGQDTFVINKTSNYVETEENQVLRELFQLLLLWKESSRQTEIVCESDGFKKIHERLTTIEPIIYEKGHLLVRKYEHVEIAAINRVINNKRQLYSEAAIILKNFRQCMKNDTESIAKMVAESFVEASDDDLCFELYWAFNLFDEVTKNFPDKKMYPIYVGGDVLCSCTIGKYCYELYHNTSKTKHSNFNVSVSELDARSKYDAHLINQNKRLSAYIKCFTGNNREKNVFLYRRPDIVIEKINEKTECLEELIIGEVKNTTNINYAFEGLSELIEYTEIAGKDEHLDSFNPQPKIKGVLCTGEIDGIDKFVTEDKAVQWKMYFHKGRAR